MGVGQGDVLATPLQLATVASLIAERGHWIRPRLVVVERPGVDGVGSTAADARRHQPRFGVGLGTPRRRDGDGGASRQPRISAERYRVSVHRQGSAVPNGRKSGTAQVVGIKQGETYNEKELGEFQRKHAWFIAFAPADAPEIAVSCWSRTVAAVARLRRRWRAKSSTRYLLPVLRRDERPRLCSVVTRRRSLPRARRLNNIHLDPIVARGAARVIVFGSGRAVQRAGQRHRDLRWTGDADLLALPMMVVAAQFEPGLYLRWTPFLYASGMVMLVMVECFGVIVKGSQRWLEMPGLPRFQPSEIMRIAVPLMVAWYFNERPLPPTFGNLIVALAIIGGTGGADRDPTGSRHRNSVAAGRARGDRARRVCNGAGSGSAVLAGAAARRVSGM